MAHDLVVGITRSGKSTLCKQIARRAMAEGRHVLVCDPAGDPTWPCSWSTVDAFDLLAVMKVNRQCIVFVDEAHEALGFSGSRQSRELAWITTGSAKFGHRVYLITQRATAISTTVRMQCAVVHAFRQQPADAKVIGNQWGGQAMSEAIPKLPPLHWITHDGFSMERYGPLSFK